MSGRDNRTTGESHVKSLVARYRDGDQDAATELHGRFVREMVARVRHILRDSRNRAAIDSQAIVQEGFKSFFSAVRKPSFDAAKGNIGGYLAAIVKNKTLAKLRRKYPSNLVAEEVNAIADAAAALSEGSLTEQEVNVSLHEALDDLVDDFTPKEREVLSCYLDEDDERSLQEIADGCGRSLATVERVIASFTAQLHDRLAAS